MSVVKELQKVVVKPLLITADNFKLFGQVIAATDDGKLFDQTDAQLVLDQGTPRLYIMRLPKRGGRTFDRITYHGRVTQCLGAMTRETWYLAVAAPTLSLDKPPKPEDIHAFRIPFGTHIKLHIGTWHAGPLFDEADHMDFINLELADTNVADHQTHKFADKDGLTFEVEREAASVADMLDIST
ncbi:hypothetical protein WJX72_002590 [[Myrmecia] bisecta]|uniref:Ureidoglycolate hydrolase n=1 Tax=[Myrmecia] bisecta TaxID=41462 RepID=A0AAW1R503_9CHLO